jgi:quinol-cytochrome oxidoreductase complex cytochrome b subunit
MIRIVQWLQASVVILLLLQLATGLLLSVVYLPSSQPHNNGTTYLGATNSEVVYRATVLGVDTIMVHNGRFIVHSDTGVPRVPDIHAETAVRINTKPLTEVQKGLEYDLYSVPIGEFVRQTHQSVSNAVVAVLVVLLTVMLFASVYSTHASHWVAAVLLLIMVLVSAWLGMLLPDNDYSAASAGIVGYSLRDGFPFGNIIGESFGIQSHGANLVRVFVLHVLFIPASVVFTVGVLRSRQESGYAVGSIIAIVVTGLFATILSVVLQQEPIWMFRMPHVLSTWLGNELLGYTMIAMFLGVITLPIWHAKVGRRAVRAVALIVLCMFITAVFL